MALLLLLLFFAGIARPVQQEYRQRYENQTVFLSVPIYGSRQRLALKEGGGIQLLPETEPLRFKVGEQVRILEMSFGDQEIRFKVATVDQTRQAELVFRFP